mgnify:FL=1
MAHLKFQWEAPTTRTDGSALGNTSITYRLYEDGVEVVRNIVEPHFTLTNIEQGARVYTVTSFDETAGLESVPSDPVTVNFVKPQAPTDLRVLLLVDS